MNYQSHFGVYALILDRDRDSVLLIKKGLGCYTGLYDLPGGGMEPQELLEDALRREVQEETDCTVTSARQLATLSILYPFQKDGQTVTLRHFGTVYLCDISGTPRTASTGLDDSLGCEWVPFGSLTDKNAAPFVVEALRLEKTGVATLRFAP